MTKAQMILDLHKQGKTTRQIAEAVYGLQPDCMARAIDKHMAYVRVVVRQRRGSRRSATDQRYLDSGGYAKAAARHMERYKTDPEFRARSAARTAAWQIANRAKRNASQRRYRERQKAVAEPANQTY